MVSIGPAPARMPTPRRWQPGRLPNSFASQTPFRLSDTLERIPRHEKNSRWSGVDLSARCWRAALDLVRASRHRLWPWFYWRNSHARMLQTPEKSRPRHCAGRLVRPFGLRPDGAGGLSVGAEFRAVRAQI